LLKWIPITIFVVSYENERGAQSHGNQVENSEHVGVYVATWNLEKENAKVILYEGHWKCVQTWSVLLRELSCL
jgi:hypothetical protein